MTTLPVPPSLAPFVAGMSIQETVSKGAIPAPYKILPRPFPVLGFQSRGRIEVLRGSGEDLLSPTGITGLCTSHRWFRSRLGTRTVLVVLKPYGAFPLLGQDLSALTDQHAGLESLLPAAPLRLLEERLAESRSDAEAAALVGAFLQSLAERSRASVHTAVAQATRRMLAEHGSEPVERIADDLGVGRRHLERLFRLQVGLAPKRFASLARFDWVVRHLDRRSSWTDLALEAGYADQAHLIRSFAAFAGTTPGRHVLTPLALAVP